jgi:hypothetical protein
VDVRAGEMVVGWDWILDNPPRRLHHGGQETVGQPRSWRVHQPHRQARFLGDFAQRGLALRFVGLDVTAGRHHPAEARMLDKADPPPV